MPQQEPKPMLPLLPRLLPRLHLLLRRLQFNLRLLHQLRLVIQLSLNK